MTIDHFFTAHTSAANAQSSAKFGGKSNGAATFASSEGNFFDIFLQNALAALEAKKTKAATVDAETSTKIDGSSKTMSAEAISTEELSVEELVNVKDVLKNAFLISDEKSMRPALNNLQRVLQELEKMAQSDNSEDLIVTNMTPEQITDLKIKVESILAGEQGVEALEENAENFAGLVIGLIKILPPQAKNDFVATGKAIILAAEKNISQDGQSMIGTKDLNARLNTLGLTSVNKGAGNESAADDTPSADSDFDSFLKQFADDTKSAKDGTKATLADTMAADKSAASGANAAATKAEIAAGVLKGLTPPMNGGLFSTADFTQGGMQEMGIVFGQTQISSISPMTSLVTQSHAATLPHPATQAVAASIQKNAANGEIKDITLRLDPAELGRVEIKMSFGKDSAIKAVMTIEKPETFMMLQRDAHILERALQDAGLETDGNSLSFEMAQDGEGFTQDGRHDGSRNQSGQNGDTEIMDDAFIQSTMTWHVDPASGHMRYNILA